MKKIVASADLGGAPFTKADLREVFNSEVWAVIEALLAPFNADTEGLIISGCVVTANGGGFDMTAGIVYLNGEFMRISAVTGQSFTKYIAPSTPTSDSRSFGDGTTHAVVETKLAGIVGSAPGAGQYITISSLISADSRRWNGGSIGHRSYSYSLRSTWNMDTTTSINITLPSYIDRHKVTDIKLAISADNAVTVFFPTIVPESIVSGDQIGARIDTIGGVATLQLTRVAGSMWDTTSYDTFSPNIAITISYLP